MIARLAVLMSFFALASPSFGADFFRIGSMNIEHLGSRTPGQQPMAIAEHFDLSGAVVIALQEINVTDTIADDPATEFNESRRNDSLDTAFAILNQEGDTDWRYELFPNRNAGDTTQLCGLAWDAKRVKREGGAYAIEITGADANRIWDRRPHAAKFRFLPNGSGGSDKTDVVIIPVHMKSNYGSAAEGRARRELEAKALTSKLDDIKAHFGNDQDLIVVGDTNILKADEAAAEEFGDAGLRDTNSLDAGTYVGSPSAAPFDRFFLAPEKEFRFARQYILQPAEPVAHDEYLSDHTMVLLSFRVVNDDD